MATELFSKILKVTINGAREIWEFPAMAGSVVKPVYYRTKELLLARIFYVFCSLATNFTRKSLS